uniref:Uncharacterized protein n=1 Tax=Picea glauca TaxID=3330 RepID=A0A117NIA4_PICGL|nr:hypothetical protein ABT39_MTgene2863 [Picea glauca]
MFASSCIDFAISHATYIRHPQTDLNPTGINRCIHIYPSIMRSHFLSIQHSPNAPQ